MQMRNHYPALFGLAETVLASRILYHSVCEDPFLDSLCASAVELSVDLGGMYDGEYDHHEEHEQRVEDVQEDLMWNEVSIVAYKLLISGRNDVEVDTLHTLSVFDQTKDTTNPDENTSGV
jgi:hypothetical protein